MDYYLFKIQYLYNSIINKIDFKLNSLNIQLLIDIFKHFSNLREEFIFCIPLKAKMKTLLSIIYILLLVIIAIITDVTFFWVFNHWLYPAITWFNSLKISWKIILFFISFTSLFGVFLKIFGKLTGVLNALWMKFFPNNRFTQLGSMIIGIVNLIYSVTIIWKSFDHFNFWLVLEFVFLLIFLIGVNVVFMVKPTMKEVERIYE